MKNSLIIGKEKRYLFLLFLCILLSLWYFICKNNVHWKLETGVSEPEENFLDGCRYVYIDLGTNIGVQIRKLYEPYLYPNAAVLPIFKHVFGNASHEVCSVGFEANPIHTNYLMDFENYCLKRNWRVKIFTSTAVTISDGNVTFYTMPNDESNNEWGASLSSGRKKQPVTVRSVNFVSWMKKTVLNRKISIGTNLSRIMMKSDIEGHDMIVLSNLILSGVYCSIDLIYGEHLSKGFQNAISLLQQQSNSCKTVLKVMDDESYYKDRFPFTVVNAVT